MDNNEIVVETELNSVSIDDEKGKEIVLDI